MFCARGEVARARFVRSADVNGALASHENSWPGKKSETSPVYFALAKLEATGTIDVAGSEIKSIRTRIKSFE